MSALTKCHQRASLQTLLKESVLSQTYFHFFGIVLQLKIKSIMYYLYYIWSASVLGFIDFYLLPPISKSSKKSLESSSRLIQSKWKGNRLIWLEIHLVHSLVADPTDRLIIQSEMLNWLCEINPFLYYRILILFQIFNAPDSTDSGIEDILRSWFAIYSSLEFPAGLKWIYRSIGLKFDTFLDFLVSWLLLFTRVDAHHFVEEDFWAADKNFWSQKGSLLVTWLGCKWYARQPKVWQARFVSGFMPLILN